MQGKIIRDLLGGNFFAAIKNISLPNQIAGG
jgi:hypothetical protein